MTKKESRIISYPIHLSTEIERLFDDLIHRPWGVCREVRGWNPSIDLYENGSSFLLEADLPGVKLEDISVEVEDGDIVLRGFRSLERTRTEGHFREMERAAGHFLRRIKLPDSVDQSQIKAEFHDGVLLVTIPKTKKAEGAAQ